jgi:hypothetical protein
MTKGQYKIPFDTDGNLMGYPEQWRDIVWRDNYQFDDVLKFDSYYRGRSAAGMFMVSTTTGSHYQMFLRDFEDLINTVIIDHGVVSGRWTFTKRGANYGIMLVINER